MTNELRYCEKCHLTMNSDTNFYLSNNLEKYPEGRLNICKKCATMHIDNWDPNTYLWLLQEMDIPYIPQEWNKLLASYGRDRDKCTGSTILGRYAAKMRLKQWKDYRWKDNDFIQRLEEDKVISAMLRQGYSTAQIEEQTRNLPGSFDFAEEGYTQPPDPPPKEEEPKPKEEEDYFAQQSGVEEIQVDLTDEDKTYLCLKWGRTYKPNEWVSLEQLYKEMVESYEIQTAGDINTLKLACKTSLKANQLLDMGDVPSYNVALKLFELPKHLKRQSANNLIFYFWMKSFNDYPILE